MEAGINTHPDQLTPRKKLSTEYMAGWPPDTIWKFVGTQKSLVPPLHWTPACPTSNLCTIQTALLPLKHQHRKENNCQYKPIYFSLSHDHLLEHCTILVHTTILCQFMVQHTNYVQLNDATMQKKYKCSM